MQGIPLLRIFRGEVRGIGGEISAEEGYFAQIYFAWRDYLVEFKPDEWMVFSALLLSADQDGWVYRNEGMGRARLQKLTGLPQKRISAVLTRLCQKKIAGQRLLLRCQLDGQGSRFGRNTYLILPKDDEIQKYDKEQFLQERTRRRYRQSTVEPCTQNGYTEKASPCTHFPCTENGYTEVESLRRRYLEWRESTVERIKSELRLRLTKAAYTTYFSRMTIVALTDKVLTLALPSPRLIEWVAARMNGILAEICEIAISEKIEIVLIAPGEQEDNMKSPKGLMWFDNSEVGLEQRLGPAIVRYGKKFGRKPTICIMNPISVGEEMPKTILGMTVITRNDILPDHFLLAENGEGKDT